MGDTPRPCDGLSALCDQTPEFRVSWAEAGHRRRRRAKLCPRCVQTLKGKALVSDVVTTALPAAGKHRADDDAGGAR